MPGAGPRGDPGSARSLRGPELRAALRGRTASGHRVILYVARGPGPSRAAFVAGRRIGGAVARNRARRLMRAAWRAVAPQVREGHHLVLAAKRGIVGAKTDDVIEELASLLSRAGVRR